MPDSFVPCLKSLYSSPQILTTNTAKLSHSWLCNHTKLLLIPETFHLHSYYLKCPSHPPTHSNSATSLGNSSNSPSSRELSCIHPSPPLSNANNAHRSHTALGIPSCYSGENQDSERERTLSRAQSMCSGRTIT